MTAKDTGETEDEELLERYRRASGTEISAPSNAVREAILGESRRLAAELRKKSGQNTLDTTRSAANDSRWKITAFGTLGAALLAALIIAPRYWETLPARKESAAAAPAAKPAAVPPKDARLSNAPAPVPAPVAARAHAPREEKRALTTSALSADSSALGRVIRGYPAQSTLLQSAAESGNVVLTTKLLDQGESVNSRDLDGRTPLMLAVAQGRVEVVRLLLKRGADPNLADNSGKTPLQLATDQNLRDIAALLKGAGPR